MNIFELWAKQVIWQNQIYIITMQYFIYMYNFKLKMIF